jgi:secondary thiamine-phosphate synthase enzyme
VIRRETLIVDTRGRGFTELTGRLRSLVAEGPAGAGLCHVWVQHTSASLIVCENADPDVLRDLEAWMARLVADGDPLFRHRAEGPDDMAAHIRSVLTATSLTLPVQDGQLELGTWQGIFLWEHRHQGHRRRVLATVQCGA